MFYRISNNAVPFIATLFTAGELYRWLPRNLNLIGLKWGDVDDYFGEVEPLIFDTEMLISDSVYDLSQFKENSERIAREFWGMRKEPG